MGKASAPFISVMKLRFEVNYELIPLIHGDKFTEFTVRLCLFQFLLTLSDWTRHAYVPMQAQVKYTRTGTGRAGTFSLDQTTDHARCMRARSAP